MNTQNTVDQNQHYVPKKFLKQFADKEGYFYQIKFRSKIEREVGFISKEHVNNVCTHINFYDLNINIPTKRNSYETDTKYLETKGFQYEKENLIKSLNIIKSGNPYIGRKEYEVIIDAYINLKQRNLFYRNLLKDNTTIAPLIDQVIDETAKEFDEDLLLRLVNFNYREFASYYKEKELSDPNRADTTHVNSLISASKGENETANLIAIELIKMNAFVVEAGDADYFLVSDNPGYTLVIIKDSIVPKNAELGNAYTIVFPINSKQAIILQGYSKDHLRLMQPLRYLRYEHGSSEAVYLINRLSTFFTTEKLFCENKDYLMSFKEKMIQDNGLKIVPKTKPYKVNSSII